MKFTLFREFDPQTRATLLQKVHGKKIAFPEWSDKRILEAKQILESESGLECVLIHPDIVQAYQKKAEGFLTQILIEKGKDPQAATLWSLDPLWVAGVMLAHQAVDAVVAGVEYATAQVIKAALGTVGLKPQSKLVTSCFLFALKEPTPGGEPYLVYADGAVIPEPTKEQLVRIAKESSDAYRSWVQREPKVAFLSFSTAGSAQHPRVEKMRSAYVTFAEQFPDILSEGETQFDAAIVPSIASRKNPSGVLKGQANVFIFPDLDSGNISYKITQRIGGASCWGPVLLGSSKPFSDLSRGASGLDVAHSAVLTLALG